MASMADPEDRLRIFERLNDSLAALEANYCPLPLSGEEPVNVAWQELRETVTVELEAAREALAA